MKILVLNGSPRPQGNTEIMVNEFAKGAMEAGNEVTIFNLTGKKIAGCIGCEYCFSHDGNCVQKDDMTAILAAMDETDMVVFASPIYWFDISGQLKCAIDRMYSKLKKGFNFHKVALLLNSGTDGVYDAAIAQYKSANAYAKWEDMGIITIPGMSKKRSMEKSKRLKEVYEFGSSISRE